MKMEFEMPIEETDVDKVILGIIRNLKSIRKQSLKEYAACIDRLGAISGELASLVAKAVEAE